MGVPRRARVQWGSLELLVPFREVGRLVLTVEGEVGVDVLQQDAAGQVVVTRALVLEDKRDLVGDVLGGLGLVRRGSRDTRGTGGQEGAEGSVGQQAVHNVRCNHRAPLEA